MSSDIPIEEDSKTTSARLSNSPTFLSESHGSTFDTIISPTSVPFQTSSTSSHTSLTTPYESILYQPNIIQFDPKASPSADEEEGDIDIEDNGQNNAGAGPRLKKRKSTMSLRNVSRSTPSNNLRSAANTDAFNAGFATLAGSTHLATEADYNFGMGMLRDDEDKDKGRRKIQIEYIEEKSKRHITFSKRKAGIMKKVSRAFFLQLLFVQFLF